MAIIKCPECGHQISDKAPTCPSCGVEIAGKVTRCPKCGEVYLNNEDWCPHCHYPTQQTAAAKLAMMAPVAAPIVNEEAQREHTEPNDKTQTSTPASKAVAATRRQQQQTPPPPKKKTSKVASSCRSSSP